MTLARTIGLFAWLTSAAAAFGCQSIAGIEDRTLETTPTDPCDEQCEACEAYCTKVQANCTGDNQVYQTPEACLGICAELPLGDPIEPVPANTVACRDNEAERARTTGEPSDHCPAAGPGGGGRCGTDCEAYCYLFPKVCGDQGLNVDLCEEKCEVLPQVQEFSIDLAYDAANVECRLIHLSNATVSDTHCGHAQFVSTLHCMRVPETDPSCELYCTVVMGACTGELAQYDDMDQCMTICAALPQGTVEDLDENTVGCRSYHSHSALIVPDNHCPHAGPGGAGHCGVLAEGVGNCESYCLLAAEACPGDFDATFGNDASCQEQCRMLDGAADDLTTSGENEAEKYSVALGEEPNAKAYRCRLLHAVRALANEDVGECPAVFGAADSACQP
jgi:hypothetical protein